MLASVVMFAPGVPEGLRRRVFSWITGGADVDDGGTRGGADLGRVHRFRVAQADTEADHRRTAALTAIVPVLALIAGRSVMLDAARAAARARNLLPRGQVELWPEASHAINGEYPTEITERAG